MSSSKNWQAAKRRARLDYVPAPGARPITQKQIDFIKVLAKQKGKSVKIPLTMRGAGSTIDRLQLLPDIAGAYRMEEDLSSRKKTLSPQQVMVEKLRAKFPKLSPLSANSLAQLAYQIDGVDHEAIFGRILRLRKIPQDGTALNIFLQRRLLDEFALRWFLSGAAL